MLIMPKPGTLAGQVVVVTGASSGLGREMAIQFAQQGCALVLCARREEDLEATAALCRAAGGNALCVPGDVSVESDVEQVVNLYRPVELGAGQVHGERPAQVGVSRFALWSAGELLRGEVSRALRLLRLARSAMAASS